MKQKRVVYLAGGMRDNWQDLIINQSPTHTFLDPRRNVGIKDEKVYTDNDLRDIESSDILFAWLHNTNPCGANMALEIGYAAAQGKRIIFCEQVGHPLSKYFGMSRAIADEYHLVTTIDEALPFYKAFLEKKE